MSVKSAMIACAALSTVLFAAPAQAGGHYYEPVQGQCCYYARPAYAYLGKGYYRPPVNFYGHPRPYEAYAGKGYPAGWFSYSR